jgi:hypothetical protein
VENTKENGKAAAPNPLRTFHGAAAGPGRQRRAGAAVPLPCSWRERKGRAEGGTAGGAQGRRRACGPGGVGHWISWGTRREGFVFGWRGVWLGRTARTDRSGTGGAWATGELQAAACRRQGVVGTWGVGFGSRAAPLGALAVWGPRLGQLTT